MRYTCPPFSLQMPVYALAYSGALMPIVYDTTLYVPFVSSAHALSSHTFLALNLSPIPRIAYLRLNNTKRHVPPNKALRLEPSDLNRNSHNYLSLNDQPQHRSHANTSQQPMAPLKSLTPVREAYLRVLPRAIPCRRPLPE